MPRERSDHEGDEECTAQPTTRGWPPRQLSAAVPVAAPEPVPLAAPEPPPLTTPEPVPLAAPAPSISWGACEVRALVAPTEALDEHGYDGSLVLEQDTAITADEPAVTGNPMLHAAESIASLNSAQRTEENHR
jgi:hypothetical protein